MFARTLYSIFTKFVFLFSFSEWMMEHGHGSRRVYIDETGFNLYTRRTYGRAPVGERMNRVEGSQRGRSITFLVAVTPVPNNPVHDLL